MKVITRISAAACPLVFFFSGFIGQAHAETRYVVQAEANGHLTKASALAQVVKNAQRACDRGHTGRLESYQRNSWEWVREGYTSGSNQYQTRRFWNASLLGYCVRKN